jgi:hypothetical protein
MPYGCDTDFRTLFVLIGLTGEDNLVVRGFQIEHIFAIRGFLDLKSRFHLGVSPHSVNDAYVSESGSFSMRVTRLHRPAWRSVQRTTEGGVISINNL